MVRFIEPIVSLAIGTLSNYPQIFSPTYEMYMSRREGSVLEIQHEIKSIYSI